MDFIDFHTHKENFESDVISLRSFRFGMEQIIWSSHTTAAIHPWDVENFENFEKFEDFKSVVDSLFAIGESGMDKNHPNLPLQEALLVKHIELSIKQNKTLTLHVVKCHNEVLNILNRYKGMGLRVAIHSFIGNLVIAQKYIDLGCYLSFSPLSLKSKKSIEVLKSSNARGKILLESDNYKHSIREVYEMASKIVGYDMDLLKEEIHHNFQKFFSNFTDGL